MPGGKQIRLADRPIPKHHLSKFKEEYCEVAERLLSEGKSAAAIAAELNVCKQTVYTWADQHKNFLDAINRGNAKAEVYYEEIARENIVMDKDKKFNSAPWVFTMKNRFGWVDRQEVNTTGNITIHIDSAQAEGILELSENDVELIDDPRY